MKTLRYLAANLFALVTLSIFSVSTLSAQTSTPSSLPPTVSETVLANFSGANGMDPADENLVQGLDGNLYGTTQYGGMGQCCGTIFKITPSGTLTTLHAFSGTDGSYLYAGLTLGVDGNFYGATYSGGTSSYGTIFKITPSGTLTTLHNFAGTDGAYPNGALIQGTDGNFYGTTIGGATVPYGSVFKITPSGGLTTLHTFNFTDGAYPTAALIQATDGDFYGTTSNGALNYGTVFKIRSSGTFTSLHSFNSTDGASPEDQLTQIGASFYGTTRLGGANGDGEVFRFNSAGLVVLHSFDVTDGSQPWGSLTHGSDGNLYGTAKFGGAYGGGTVFRVTPSGSLNTIYGFGASNTDGGGPVGGLVQHTSGIFFGTTIGGGSGFYGTLFSLDAGLRPFVGLLPGSGKVGSKVTILGTNLIRVSKVTFNGIVASFTPVSSTYITATVPTGATTGMVAVTTNSGTLKSNQPFRVR